MSGLLISILALASGCFAQSGILNSTRYEQWAGGQAGTTVPIPAYSGTAATINNALSSCASANPSGSYLLLGSGTFTLSTGILMNGLSNIILRGGGPSSTTLAFTGGVGCFSGNQDICVKNTSGL